jgi:hypothetical protein
MPTLLRFEREAHEYGGDRADPNLDIIDKLAG